MSNNVVTYIYKRYCHIADTDLQIFHQLKQNANEGCKFYCKFYCSCDPSITDGLEHGAA